MNRKEMYFLRSIVIDWLQYSNDMNEDRAQNTITLIHELETQLKRAIKVMEYYQHDEQIGQRARDFLKEVRGE